MSAGPGLQACPSHANAVAGRRLQHGHCRRGSSASRVLAQPVGDTPAAVSGVLGSENAPAATSTVEVILTGLEDFPDSQTGSIEEVGVEEVATEGSRDEENPYTPEDALR